MNKHNSFAVIVKKMIKPFFLTGSGWRNDGLGATTLEEANQREF